LGLECIQAMNAEVITAMLRRASAEDGPTPPASGGTSAAASTAAATTATTPAGSLIIDATCAPTDITFPPT
jgi:hypothetical protein